LEHDRFFELIADALQLKEKFHTIFYQAHVLLWKRKPLPAGTIRDAEIGKLHVEPGFKIAQTLPRFDQVYVEILGLAQGCEADERVAGPAYFNFPGNSRVVRNV
jgi:hypothetical protein